jgi:hypothetical protein
MLSTEILPPCNRIICLERLKPIPEPSSLVEKNGTKISSIKSASIPEPLSVTEINACLFKVSAFKIIWGRSQSLTASMAFFNRLH